MKSNLVDIEVTLMHQTEKAWLVSLTGERENSVWIAKSMGELSICTVGRYGTLTLPEPIAIDKGLV